MLGKLLIGGAALVAAIAMALPIIFSEVAGGWTVAARSPWSLKDMPDLTGKTALVTGASTGIGRVTAIELARAGARVFIHGRKAEQMEKLKSEIEEKVVLSDFTDLQSIGSMVRGMGSTLNGSTLDIAILNAGYCKDCMNSYADSGFELTKDGFEKHIQVNHLAHQLLVEWLMHDGLLDSESCRLVTVSSMGYKNAHETGVRPETWTQRADDYTEFKAYGQSKLANILMARELNRRFTFSSVSLHPGVIATDIWRGVNHEPIYAKFMNFIFSSASMTTEQGALNQLWAAVRSKPESAYYNPVASPGAVHHPAFNDESSQAV
eukprot:CAMPEP_0206426286 /NCGR_PEP_ID=MMETSP0324_2-20121206/4285_1 /ASSEMBLY_ACC=CAM_ASM_000836 /TAXON_ID=2866 /ORGANISM="Crypthecodinium cohnii, Strain Seligo" /LENGTH=320 /DNA_ID=CAMNT_0053891207 /DNA_START=154 /DNA_END=1112 /DNA_ORIENTATION=-